MRIWIDIKNSHEPLFFKSITSSLGNHEYVFTARDFVEVKELMRKYGFQFTTVGKHHGRNLVMKLYGFLMRDLGLFIKSGKFDVALSHNSTHCINVAYIKRKKSIAIYDNDLPTYGNRLSLPFLDYLLIPECIEYDKFKKFSKRVKVIKFRGYKEDIYIAEYKPDPCFPYKDFVALRPEALKAEYVPKNVRSIVPEILQRLNKVGLKVLYLPRYKEDRNWIKSYRNVCIPPGPLNGLDVCYYSKAVLTGSGTFAREAAIMGTPAISFFPGKQLLSVDQNMIRSKWMIHSRQPSEIVDFVKNSKKKCFRRERSRATKDEVIGILKQILEEI